MDPLSVIASVAGIATATFQIIGFLGTIKEGGKERLSLLNEVTHLWLAVVAVQAQIASEGDSPDKKLPRQLRPLFESDGIIRDIETLVEHLERKLKSRSSYGKVRRSLTWPLDKQDVSQAIERIHRLQQTLQLAATQSTHALTHEIYRDGKSMRSVISETQRKDIIEWLSPSNFAAKQNMLFAEHRKGTCRWFLQRKDFLAWKQEDNAMLFCPGIPGAGKTVLSSVVAHELDSECDASDAAVLMLYCKWDDSLSQSIDALLGSLLKQATHKNGIILQEMAELYYRHSSAGTKPTREETLSMLTAELRQFSKTFIIVDGLDELREEKTRVDLLVILTSIDATVNLMVTSRGLDSIVRHFRHKSLRPSCNECLVPCIRQHLSCPDCNSSSPGSINFNLCQSCFRTGKRCGHRGHVLCGQFSGFIIKVTAVEEDLMTYVQWRVASSDFLRHCVELKEELMKSILDIVVKENDGMFLLAKFNMDTLTSKLRPAEVVKALKILPKELDGTYTDAMLRVADLPASHREVVMELLRWVVFAEQPLKMREIEHAIAVTEGDRDIDRDNLIRANVIASKCAGLIVFDESDRLRLVHFSAENFFNRNRDRWFPEGPKKLASTCLTYLLFDTFQSGACSGSSESAEFYARIEKYPLLSYAAKFWGKHLVQTPHESLYGRARELLGSSNHLAALTQMLWYLDYEGSASWAGKQGSSALHLATHFGLNKLVMELLAKGVDPNIKDMNGTAPLALAAKKSNVDVALMLIRAGAAINTMDNIGAAPLHEAARHGQEELVKLLVEQDRIDINIMHTRWSQRTPLMIASTYGYTGIIRLLLDTPQLNINQECSDPQGATALILAALSSEVDAVQLLLTHPAVNVNHKDHSGTTALIYAAHRGDRKVAEALLDKGADAGICQYGSGGTALNRAIDQNAIPLVELLVGRGANVHHKDAFGRSPLHSAACNGRTEIMRILLEFDKSLDVNMQDKNGKTTLHDVALCGYMDTAQFLLEHGADPTIRDHHDRTPMRIAQEMNEIAIMDLLRAAQEKEPHKQPGKFEPLPLRRNNTALSIDTPLSLWALAKSNLTEEVRARLSNDPSTEINLRDPDLGQTALHHSTANDNVEMVEMLISHGADLNIGNTWERKPLHLAALHNSAGSAEILLKAGAEIDAKDHWGHTPLMISSISRLSIATLLVSNGADISDSRLNLNKLLGLAAENGNRVAVQRLVEAGAELWRKNSLGYSPFMVAKMYNHDEIADLILELGQPSDFTTATGLPTTDDKRNERNDSTRESLHVPEDGSTISQSRHSRLNQTIRQEFEGFDVGHQKKPFEPESTKASKEIKKTDNTLRKNYHLIPLLWEQTLWVILTTLFFLIAATAVIRPKVRKIESMDTFFI